MIKYRKKVKDKKELKKKLYQNQINKLDDSINFKNNVIGESAKGAVGHYLGAQLFNSASVIKWLAELNKKMENSLKDYQKDIKNAAKEAKSGKNFTRPEFKKPVMRPVKTVNGLNLAGYGAAREVGAHAINKIKPDMPYEAKYGISSAIASPLLAPKAIISSTVPLTRKLGLAGLAGLFGAGTAYIHKKDVNSTKNVLNKKIQKLNKKSVKDSIHSLVKNTTRMTLAKTSQLDKASRIILKNPKTVGALVGLAILAGIGKFAHYKHNKDKKNKAQDASVSNNLIPLGKQVNSIIKSYKPQFKSGYFEKIKSLITKYPKTTALIAGTAVVYTGMNLSQNNKGK